MKKKFAFIVFLLCMCMTATACHGTKKHIINTVPETFDESKTYEISFWAKNDTNKNQVAIYNKAVADFEALYPNIKVNIRFYTDYTTLYNDVITNISTDTTPNVCITYPDHIATYMTGENTVVTLDELFTNPKYGFSGASLKFETPMLTEIVPKFLDECKIGEHYYAVPFMRSTEACYVNKTYVEALGYTLPETLTWDFVWEVSEAALKKNADGTYAVNNQNVLIPFIYKSTDNMMITGLRQKNAGYSDENGNLLIFNDTTRELLSEIAIHAESRAFSTFKISSYPANFLNAGQCIFAIDSTAGATWMGSDAPLLDISEDTIVKFETAVMTVPQFDTKNPQMISQGPSICIFNKEDPDTVMASWIFTMFLLSNDVQIAYSETEGYVPVTLKAQNSQEYSDYLARAGEDNQTHYKVKIDASRLLLNNIDNTFVTPVFSGSANLREAAGALIENTVKSVRRKTKFDDTFVKNLYKEVKAQYRLDEALAVSQETRAELGEMPTFSKILLIVLSVIWAVIIAVYIKKKKDDKKRNPQEMPSK